MIVDGQEVPRTAGHYPDWENNAYDNLSEISENSVQPNPDDYGFKQNDTSSKESALVNPEPLVNNAVRDKIDLSKDQRAAWCFHEQKCISEKEIIDLLKT
jgi:hypothetical protein